MPRGKKSIIDESNLPVINTDEETGTIPFFLIDETYGVACDQYGYMLCKKKSANKTIKDEEGNLDHIESYYTWTPFKYTGTFESIIKCYIEQKERGLNKRLVKQKDFKKLLEIREEIYSIVYKAFNTNGINKEFLSVSNLLDQKVELENEIKNVIELKNNLTKQCNELEKLIKEKRKIIVEKHTAKK